MTPLKQWLDAERGRTTALAKHLGLTQPAVTQLAKSNAYQNLTHAKKIMQFTELTAYELFPEWVAIFNLSDDIVQDRIKIANHDLALFNKKLDELKELKRHLDEASEYLERAVL